MKKLDSIYIPDSEIIEETKQNNLEVVKIITSLVIKYKNGNSPYVFIGCPF